MDFDLSFRNVEAEHLAVDVFPSTNALIPTRRWIFFFNATSFLSIKIKKYICDSSYEVLCILNSKALLEGLGSFTLRPARHVKINRTISDINHIRHSSTHSVN